MPWEICSETKQQVQRTRSLKVKVGQLSLGFQCRWGGKLSHPNNGHLGRLNQKRTNINKGLAFDAVYLLSLFL